MQVLLSFLLMVFIPMATITHPFDQVLRRVASLLAKLLRSGIQVIV